MKPCSSEPVGLEFGGEIHQKYSSKYPRGKTVTPVPSDPAVLLYFQDIVGKMQNAPPKKAHNPSPLVPPGSNDPFQTPHNGMLYASRNPGAETSYASCATSAMYTSTTCINGPSNSVSPSSVQTRIQCFVVIEQYEHRFVHMEGQLSTVEKSVSKLERMPGPIWNLNIWVPWREELNDYAKDQTSQSHQYRHTILQMTTNINCNALDSTESSDSTLDHFLDVYDEVVPPEQDNQYLCLGQSIETTTDSKWQCKDHLIKASTDPAPCNLTNNISQATASQQATVIYSCTDCYNSSNEND